MLQELRILIISSSFCICGFTVVSCLSGYCSIKVDKEWLSFILSSVPIQSSVLLEESPDSNLTSLQAVPGELLYSHGFSVSSALRRAPFPFVETVGDRWIAQLIKYRIRTQVSLSPVLCLSTLPYCCSVWCLFFESDYSKSLLNICFQTIKCKSIFSIFAFLGIAYPFVK